MKLDVVALLVINTTLEFGGIVPPNGTGIKTPPPVIVELMLLIKVWFKQRPCHASPAVGHETVNELVGTGDCPV